MSRLRVLVVSLALALCLLPGGRPDVAAQAPAVVTLLHINDIYEIDAIEGGRVGGLSRVATLLNQLKRTRPPVLTTLGGDYLSPSAIGTAVVDGEPLGGRQMVDVLNTLGLDWATLGNHEFDFSETAFRARLVQSRFRIVTSNVTDAKGQLFPGTVRSAVVPLRSGLRTVRLGLIGLTIDSNLQPWVRYAPPVESARAQIKQLAGKVDAIIAITHLALDSDQDLVSQIPEIDLVVGGHEHENWLLRRGQSFVPIVKADANVRSVAVLTLTFGKPKSRPTVSTRFQFVDDTIAKEPKVDAVVQRWKTEAFDAFRKNGFSPETTVAMLPEPLDGREATVRNRPGPLTDLILAGFVRDAGMADVAILNGGSIRIDDVLQPGAITEYDVIRVLPFGGKVLKATFDGGLLASVLDMGQKNAGTGGYLQTWGVERQGGQWLIQKSPLDPARQYVVAISDFLLTGREVNLGFLTKDNPGVHDVQELRDVRRGVIEELQAHYPASAR